MPASLETTTIRVSTTNARAIHTEFFGHRAIPNFPRPTRPSAGQTITNGISNQVYPMGPGLQVIVSPSPQFIVGPQLQLQVGFTFTTNPEPGDLLVVSDEIAEEKVRTALEPNGYQWVTIPWIAKETGLPENRIRGILSAMTDVVRSRRTGNNAERLYTTRKHYRETEFVLNRILSAFSGRIE